MEKASSLIEVEENLDPITDVGDTIGSDDETKSALGRAGHAGHSSVERRRADRSDELEEGSLEPGVRSGSAAVTHPRSFKPIESGVFSGAGSQAPGGHVALSLQNALSSASRGEAELAAMHRALRDASRALTASRHAHESVTEDLRMMHRGLSEVMSEKAAVERYAALLTQERDAALDAAEEARREAKREREFLLREQDRFIQLLLEEHEAELQQLRHDAFGRTLGARPSTHVSANAMSVAVNSQILIEESAPATSPGLAPPALGSFISAAEHTGAPDDEDDDVPTTPRAAGLNVARLQLAERPSSVVASGERHRAIPLPGAAERGVFDKSLLETQRSEVLPAVLEKKDADKTEPEERPATYPPPPAVLDLDSLAHEVDGNSERPPPIRRIGASEPKLHLRPARVPTQLLDTLVSMTGDEPTRKS